VFQAIIAKGLVSEVGFFEKNAGSKTGVLNTDKGLVELTL
jgi:hypothetical protein